MPRKYSENVSDVPNDVPKVLVVDDEPSYLRLAELALSRAGFEVVTATTGEEALARVKADGLAAVVLDVRMPGLLGGIDALLEIRAVAPTLPVLLCTMAEDQHYAVLAAVAGAADHLWKLDPRMDRLEYLAQRVEQLLAAPRRPPSTRLSEEVEQVTLLQALAVADYNVSEAAGALGLRRSTLQSKLKAYSLAQIRIVRGRMVRFYKTPRGTWVGVARSIRAHGATFEEALEAVRRSFS